MVAMDITEPFPESEQKNCYILVVADYYTKWVECFAIPDQEAKTIAQRLVDEFFCRFAIPDQIHSDQGRQFESSVMTEVCKLLQIEKTRTTPYHPQFDGQVERFNRTLVDMLSATCKEHPFDWENHLKKVCFAYNTIVHASTGYSPFELMFGRLARMPLDLVLGTDRETARSPAGYVIQLKDRL